MRQHNTRQNSTSIPKKSQDVKHVSVICNTNSKMPKDSTDSFKFTAKAAEEYVLDSPGFFLFTSEEMTSGQCDYIGDNALLDADF